MEQIQNYIKTGRTVSIIIVNGYLMRGVITKMDEQTITVKCPDSGEKVVFKHAISTIGA